MTFKCWVPDEGYNRTDATEIEAGDAEEAVELFAERWYEGGDHFPQLDVCVAPWGSGVAEEQAYRVTVDFDPSFHASKATPAVRP